MSDPNHPGSDASNPYGQPYYGVTPPLPADGQPAYYSGIPPNPYGLPGADHPKATTILVLGILSVVGCYLFTGIPAWVMGGNALREIDASGGRIGGRGTVKAGMVLGIVGTALSALLILVCGGVLALAILAGGTETFTSAAGGF